MFSDSVIHAQAAEICLSCLQPNARLEARRVYKDRYNSYFFSSYADRYWLAHCQSISEDEGQNGLLGELYSEFFSDKNSKPVFIAWMDFCRNSNEAYQRRADDEIIASAPLGPFFSKLADILGNAYHSGKKENPGPQSTALHHAVEWNCNPMVLLLVENGADVHAVSKSGETPFHRAVSLGYDDIANFLAEHGSDVH